MYPNPLELLKNFTVPCIRDVSFECHAAAVGESGLWGVIQGTRPEDYSDRRVILLRSGESWNDHDPLAAASRSANSTSNTSNPLRGHKVHRTALGIYFFFLSFFFFL